jgi:hypothetical protein
MRNVPIVQSASEIPSMLPAVIESNPNAAVSEAGGLARNSSRKLIEQGQLSLF